MSKTLSLEVTKMERARTETDPVAELRRWRLQAQLRYVGKSAAVTKPKGPRK